MPREILRYPHPDLKRRCAEAAPGPDAERIAAELVETMRSFPRCVGVAAPQIGELIRIVVVDVSEHPKATTSHGCLELVNPVVVAADGDELGREGCLSVPDLTANVRRAARVSLRALTPRGEQAELEAEGFEARALLHELDHLDGILFLDRVATSSDVFPRKRSA